MSDNLSFVVLPSFVLAILVATFIFFGWRDTRLNEWASRYEECVKVEYNTTPTAWYLEHNEYPVCAVK